MDPISAITFANECIGICMGVAKITKRVIEAVRNLRDELLQIVRRAERMRNILTIVKGIAQRLQASNHRDLLIAINKEACMETIDELHKLASKIAESRQRNRLIAGLQWSQQRSTAEQLCTRMQKQEEEMIEVIQLIHM